MKISIIIPTINRYSDLRNTIGYLMRQSVQDFEIIIIDQTDKDKWEDIASLSNKIVYQWFEIKSASAARNKGILLAKGEVLLFIDDDVIIEDVDFLANHLKNYEDSTVPGVAGMSLDVGQSTRDTRHKWSNDPVDGWLFFPLNYTQAAKIASGRSNNLSVRRSCALAVGGMDENYDKGAHREEADFCVRVSRKYGLLNYDPQARLVHIGNPLGGIRSWNSNRWLKAQHHFDGSLYFLFKMVPFTHLPKHIFATLLFFFYKKQVLKSPKILIMTFLRFIKGIGNGYSLYKKGPQYLSQK